MKLTVIQEQGGDPLVIETLLNAIKITRSKDIKSIAIVLCESREDGGSFYMDFCGEYAAIFPALVNLEAHIKETYKANE